MHILRSIAAALVILAACTQAAAQSSDDRIPGGASSLQEGFDDWRVACQAERSTCFMSQQQAQQDGQRVLTIELRPAPDGDLAGTLVLPFGLLLDEGVVFQVDDLPESGPLRFRTCLPVGCVVPLAFDAATVERLRVGNALKLATVVRNGEALPFAISLKGFSAALDRLRTLAGGKSGLLPD